MTYDIYIRTYQNHLESRMGRNANRRNRTGASHLAVVDPHSESKTVDLPGSFCLAFWWSTRFNQEPGSPMGDPAAT